MINVVEYLDEKGRSSYEKWFNSLSPQAAAKVAKAVIKMGQGNVSNVEPKGAGVSAYKINWGPGYRIYFGQDGGALIILLGGGTKRRQQKDIDNAKELWTEYKRRKRSEK